MKKITITITCLILLVILVSIFLTISVRKKPVLTMNDGMEISNKTDPLPSATIDSGGKSSSSDFISMNSPNMTKDKNLSKSDTADMIDSITLARDSPLVQREKYLERSTAIQKKVMNMVAYFQELEKKSGIVTHKHPNGEKNSVDILNENDEIIGKLVYLINDRISQILEWKNGKQNGITAFLRKDGFPYKIMSFKDNKLNGPYYHYVHKGELKGALIYFVEFKDHNRLGLSLGWSPSGEPLKACRLIKKPMPWNGLP